MKIPNPLMHYVQSYFQSYLSAHRGLSPNTILAYRDALKLFLGFCAKRQSKEALRLSLEDLTAEATLAFLQELESVQTNSVVTRNHRLAALRAFFRYLVIQDPTRAHQYQRVISVPLKRGPRPLLPYLEIQEVKTILDHILEENPSARRDQALFRFFYNTGARVQEVVDLTVGSVRFEAPLSVTLVGKGRKTRQVPLWPDTVDHLKSYLTERGILQNPQAPLFTNARGTPLTRFGVHHILRARVAAAVPHCASLHGKRISPHTFRHTTAMHLLQSGVDLTVIQNWLGHVQLATTHTYVEINLEMKRKALSVCAPLGDGKSLHHLLRKNKDVITWLSAL